VIGPFLVKVNDRLKTPRRNGIVKNDIFGKPPCKYRSNNVKNRGNEKGFIGDYSPRSIATPKM